MASAYIERRKAQKKCTRCAQDAPLGQGVCFDCADKMAEAKKNIVAQGKCQNCWQADAQLHRLFCPQCQDKRREKDKARYRYRKTHGICTQCGKEAAWHGRLIGALCWAKNHGF